MESANEAATQLKQLRDLLLGRNPPVKKRCYKHQTQNTYSVTVSGGFHQVSLLFTWTEGMGMSATDTMEIFKKYNQRTATEQTCR